jgi:hypothetical protein
VVPHHVNTSAHSCKMCRIKTLVNRRAELTALEPRFNLSVTKKLTQQM